MRPNRFSLPALLLSAVTLTACIEVDMTIDVLGQDQARVSGFMQMNKQMFDMSGGDTSFCDAEEGGTLTITDTHARCDFIKEGSFAEVLTRPEDVEGPAELQGELVYLDSNRVRAMFPMGAFNEGTAEMAADPQAEAMMRAMMAGLSITMRVRGAEVESTTGTLSDDGKSASVTIGLDDIFDKTRAPITDFATIVKF
ncbi:MAG: hypothetical protein ACK4HW_05035 [Roseinatronobacter sp.]